MSYTKGPWEWGGRLRELNGAAGVPVIAFAPYENSWLAFHKEQGVREANARLIAAAPDLLEALIDVLPYAQAAIGRTESAWPSDSVILKARAAIEKATKP